MRYPKLLFCCFGSTVLIVFLLASSVHRRLDRLDDLTLRVTSLEQQMIVVISQLGSVKGHVRQLHVATVRTEHKIDEIDKFVTTAFRCEGCSC